MKNENDMQHGMLRVREDVSGWIGTEKFEGCRGYWDGFEMWTRGGFRVEIPQQWRDELPVGFALDGEIYAGPGGEAQAIDFTRHGRFLDGMTFEVFDAPEVDGTYLERLGAAADRVGGIDVRVVEARVLKSNKDAFQWLEKIQSNGGEGIVARVNALAYVPGRTSKILKIKTADSREITAGDVDLLEYYLERGEVSIV